MAPISRKRSHSDMQHAEGTIPAEYSDADFFHEVLQLEDGQTEAIYDSSLAQEAEKLGITISRPQTPNEKQHDPHISLSESALTVTSHHRTASTGSQGSDSTGITSRSSNEQLDNNSMPRKRANSGRSLSFSEYDKYLLQVEAQDPTSAFMTPMPSEPAPSLFSVSTRKSFTSIKSGFKTRFKLRRSRESKEDVK
jgi:hypothetical protein